MRLPAALPPAAMIRRVLVPVAIVAVLGVGVALIAPMVRGGSPAAASTVKTDTFPSGAGVPGIFTDTCGYSHSAADDPILAPGRPGTSMHHDFYGSTATSAASSAGSLVGGSTTCSTGADASAYWTPTVYQDGRALTPGKALIYWRKTPKDAGPVKTVPAGLQMIAGDETGTRPQPLSVVRWTCTGDGTDSRPTGAPHDCTGDHDVRLIVEFPSCWDGHTLTGADQRNVVYPTGGAGGASCPADHPVRIPQVVFHVPYPTASAEGLTLSMSPTMQGSPATAHVDFMNGWTQSTLDADVAACTAASTRCGPVKGDQATPAGPNPRQLAKEQRTKQNRAGSRQRRMQQRMQQRQQRRQERKTQGTTPGMPTT